MPFLKDALVIELGNKSVQKIYLGTQKVWEPTFSPASISGLTVWWDASKETSIASGLTAWAGSITGSLYGSPNPVLRTDTSANGLQHMRLAANQGRIRPVTSTGIAREWTLVYVGRMWGATFGRLWSACNTSVSTNVFVGWYGSGNAKGWGTAYDGQGWLPASATAVIPNPPYPTPWIVHSADSTATGPSFRAWWNGRLIGTRSVSTVGLGGGCGLSGYVNNTAVESCDADFGELCMYNRKLTDTERLTVESYMRNRWT